MDKPTYSIELDADQVAHTAAALSARASDLVEQRRIKPFDMKLIKSMYVNHACMLAIRKALDQWGPLIHFPQSSKQSRKDIERDQN